MQEQIPDTIYDIGELCLTDDVRKERIEELLKNVIIDERRTRKIEAVFKSEMALALAERESSLQMENTYIPELPDGTEEGMFLALDLGGTNFRVLLLQLHNGHVIREVVKHYHIEDDMRVGCGLALFDYIAECVTDFVLEQQLEDQPLPMGFTFSFPMRQHSLKSGSLVTWTKSFNCPSVVGEDVVRLLNEALRKCGHNQIEVMAILNDTTGTLVQGASFDGNTRIGIVLGTGSNACYVERADCVQHWETERHGEKNVVIDIEWGAFGDNGVLDFIKTPFDVQVDATSLLTNSFTFEKYIGGKYLGELARVILEKLKDEKLLFASAPDSLFPEPWKFGTDKVSQIELDTVDDTIENTKAVLSNYGYTFEQDYNVDDIRVIQYVSTLISLRAAQLVSITTACVLDRMDDENITVAIDGSVYKHHPRLKGWIERTIQKLAPKKKFHLMLTEDGSGKGAALVAAIAMKLRKQNLL